MIHFFDGSTYLRHNLRDGFIDGEPGLISDHWGLPSSFAPIDLAFYGTGAEEGHLFLCSGTNCARFDTRTGSLIGIESINKAFPTLAILFPSPQLFLVEDYALETHIGPLQRGELEDSVVVPRHKENRPCD
jgi:hypothetical protein